MTKRTYRKGPPKMKRLSGRLRELVAYKRLKNNEKSLTVRPNKWSQSLMGGGRLLEVPTVRL